MKLWHEIKRLDWFDRVYLVLAAAALVATPIALAITALTTTPESN